MKKDTEDISQILSGNQIEGALYLGSLKAAHLSLLKTKNISAVLTIAHDSPIRYSISHSIAHKIIPAFDQERYNITQHFQQAFQFIQNSRHWTNVLVHCIAGVSRSATIVIAYFMKKYKWSTKEAYSLVKQNRIWACPNIGFCYQLREYEKQIIQPQQQHVQSQYSNSYPLVNQSIQSMNEQKMYAQYCKYIQYLQYMHYITQQQVLNRSFLQHQKNDIQYPYLKQRQTIKRQYPFYRMQYQNQQKKTQLLQKSTHNSSKQLFQPQYIPYSTDINDQISQPNHLRKSRCARKIHQQIFGKELNKQIGNQMRKSRRRIKYRY